jgi:type IV pilus assembly protein PilF
MSLRLLVILSAIALTSACVTEVSGRQVPEANPRAAAESNMQLGVGYLRQGNLQAAQEKLERAVEQDPKLVEARLALGLVYERLDDPVEAEATYKRAVQVAGDDHDALNAYAAFLCRVEGRRDDALKYFDRAAEIPLSKKYVNRAVIYTNAGVCLKPVDLERSEEYLRLALRTDPRYREALLQMADVAHQRENNLQARAFLERYLAVGRATPAVLWLGVQIEQSNGDVAAAADYAKQLKQDFPASVETRLLLEQERNAG